MASRAVLIAVSFVVVGIVGAQGDEPTGAVADGRVVEGTVVAAGEKPVQGAKVFFSQPERGLAFVEGATATTDAQGRYRVDLSQFPWSTNPIQALVLASGFEVFNHAIEAGKGATTVDFELAAQPWKETEFRLKDEAGRPVEDVEVVCSLGHGLPWARLRSDTEGQCRITMAPGMPISLSVRPDGARPIRTTIGQSEDEPASITLPVLPPIRGRVVDPEGQPVPDIAVGMWIVFEPDGVGRMIPAQGADPTSTDDEGEFTIAPEVYARWAHDLTVSRRTKTGVLCFADPGFRRMAYRPFDPTGAIEPMEVTLGPVRPVRVPIVRGSVAWPAESRLSASISITPHPDIPALRWPLVVRMLVPGEGAEALVIKEALPEGTYQMEVSLTDPGAFEAHGRASRELVVPTGENPLDLPPLAIGPSDSLQMAGRPAPEIEATDLDTGRPVRLADFRGKVVVLDFWGYWCGPCNISMPYLMELHDKFEGRPLEIVALHDQSVQLRTEYDQKIAVVRERLWGGRDLPFRVLLDRPDPERAADVDAEATGATIRRYGIRAFPTLFVIDRDGTVVESVPPWNHDRLESLVQELVEKAEAR